MPRCLVNVQTIHTGSTFVGAHALERLLQVLSCQGRRKQP
jgi:hypothetical protein